MGLASPSMSKGFSVSQSVLIGLFALAVIVSCSGNSAESSFKRAVNDYWSATASKNWERVASYFFSAKIASMGGIEQATKSLSQAMEPLKITDWKAGGVQLHHIKGDIYVAVADITFEADRANKINGKTYHIKSETGVIGHTDNSGKT